MRKFYTTTDVAKICNVSSVSIIRWIREGKLKTSLTGGGHHRIPLDGLLDFLKELKIPIPEELLQNSLNPKILIVDDDASIRQMLRVFLKEYLPDAEVQEAEDGFVAGWKTQHFKPDLVLLDIMMPALDGFKYCEFIRRSAEAKKVRIIAISGVTGFDYEAKIKSCGANDFLQKPFAIEQLKEKIQKQLKA